MSVLNRPGFEGDLVEEALVEPAFAEAPIYFAGAINSRAA